MEYPRFSLVVLTLLQLCPAEQFAPQWYSASDGFQPKPISELFTTETSFSSQKPIVVNQFSSVSDDPIYSSSPVPLTQSEATLSQNYPTVAMPAGALYKVHLTQLDPLKPINVGQQKYESIVPFIQTISNTQPGFELTQVAEVAPFRPGEVQPLEPKQTYTSGLPLTSLFEPQKTTFNQPQMQTTVYQPPQTQSTIYSTLPTTFSTTPTTTFSTTPPTTFSTTPLTTFSTTPPTTFSTTPPTTFTTTPYTPFSTTLPTTSFSTTPSTPFSTTPFTTYSTPPQTFRSTPPTTFSTASSYPTNPSSATFRPPNSNYILIYQQAPQSFQTIPPSPEVTIRQSTPTTVNLPPRTEFSTTIYTTTPMPPFLSTKPVNKTSTMSTSSVKVTSSSSFGISNQRDCVKYSLCRVSTTVPLPSGLNKKGTGIGFPLKIRVIAPLGSITNVNINPVTTTKRPVTKKTKRPTTRRTSKPKKNNYDRCLDGCKKVRDPICAAPLSHVTIDPKTLRGFPSVCHMACHNSYRDEPFEKVIDGSCSKLRTRIRLIDSKSKLRRDELQKNEYSVDTDPDTVIEVLSSVN